MTTLLLLSVCFLAYSNGANDNFKGVASLFGSRTTGYPTAITWATVTTFAGSVAAIFLAQALLKKFSGKGLVPDALAGSDYFLLAVAAGAGATVILATFTGFPISTTHALMGAMVGSGWGGRRITGSAWSPRPSVRSPPLAYSTARDCAGGIALPGVPLDAPASWHHKRVVHLRWQGTPDYSDASACFAAGVAAHDPNPVGVRRHADPLCATLRGAVLGDQLPASNGCSALPERRRRQLRSRPE